jgi:hypothetical protein
MAAQFVDALKGYEFFLLMRGEVTRRDVNEYLLSNRRKIISKRTFDHYQSLLEHGFRSYVPINKFDVFQALGKLQMAADRRRYSRENTEINAKVSKDRINWIPAKVIDWSIVGFGMTTLHKLPVKPGKLIWIRKNQYFDIPATLVWKKRSENNLMRFGIRALEFIENYRISVEEIIVERPKSLLQVRKISEYGISWRELQRIIAKTDEMIEAATVLLYSIAEVAKIELKLEPPILSSIKFSSPGFVKINIDLDVGNLTKVVLEKIQFWGIDKKRRMEEIRKLSIENDGTELHNDTITIKNISLQIENLRNAVKFRRELIESGIPQEIANSVFREAMRCLGIKQLPSHISKPGSLEYGIIIDRLIPAVTELVAGDDPEIEVKVKKIPSDKQ